MATILGSPWNRRVTCDASPSNDRSESQIVANPLDPYNLVAASKRFTDPMTYDFSLACYASFDGAQTWMESPPLALEAGWAGLSDPALAWDNSGNCFLAALPIGPGANTTIGIAIYKSADGGRTWSPPNLIHSSGNDDKQWAVGDTNPASPFYGNVYIAWDDGSSLRFARTTDHGVTWKGVTTGGTDEPPGSSLANNSMYPGMAIGPDGSLYIFWTPGDEVQFVRSTDGGGSFSSATAPSAVVASGITNLLGAAPVTDGWTHLPGGTFRVITNCNAACGSGNVVAVAWADYREGVSRIYYRYSNNGGGTWHGPASGEPLLTGGAVPAANQHDFHPQLASMPTGEIACSFYEFGPKAGGSTPLIDTVLALSTDNAKNFTDRIVVTDSPWDPTVDAPWSHGDPNVTFIGDYFGLAGSRLGFFPAWTDTRTGVQEIYTARVTFRPADVYIRDSSSDIGDVPSPGYHWEYPDLIVRRQDDGLANFVNEDLLRDGHTDHFIYARVKNRGDNRAENVQLTIVVGNYPSLQGLPGAEFNYPRDWFEGDWTTPAEAARHLALMPSVPTTVNAGQTKIIGPVLWPAAQIPPSTTWHPCLLAEARADNDASHGGARGAPVDSGADQCHVSAYFWGINGAAQRNLTYATVAPGLAGLIEFPFILGGGDAGIVELVIDKGRHLAKAETQIQFERVEIAGDGGNGTLRDRRPVWLELPDGGRVVLHLPDGTPVGEVDASAGFEWHPAEAIGAPAAGSATEGVATMLATAPAHRENEPQLGIDPDFGGAHERGVWRPIQQKAAIHLPLGEGQLYKATLTLRTPMNLEPDRSHLIRLYQRRGRVITGGVFLEVGVRGRSAGSGSKRGATSKRRTRATGATGSRKRK
jgi:hypothetical protein